MADEMWPSEHYIDNSAAYTVGDKRPLTSNCADTEDVRSGKKSCGQRAHSNDISDHCNVTDYGPKFTQYYDPNCLLPDVHHPSDGLSGSYGYFSENALFEDAEADPMNWTAYSFNELTSTHQDDQLFSNQIQQLLDDCPDSAMGFSIDQNDLAIDHVRHQQGIATVTSSCAPTPAREPISSTEVQDLGRLTESRATNGSYLLKDDQELDSSFKLSSSSEEVEGGQAQFDTCFGVLIESVKVSKSLQQDTDTMSIELRPFGDILSLYLKDSGKYIGILTNKALTELVREHNTKICATLVSSNVKPQKDVAKSGKASSEPTMRRVRMLLYGSIDNKESVAKLLSEAGLYLQHPSVNECDRDTVYDNPQYLVRPGSRMPLLDNSSSMFDGCDEATNAYIVDEARKSALMRVFDSVTDNNISVDVCPSRRLTTTLKEHQQKALAFMIEKESGFIEEPQFFPLWKRANSATTNKAYRHAVTGVYEDTPKITRGGILADEMGLGKSLSLLALVCASLDSMQDSNISQASSKTKESLATLIVTPKSTIPGWQHQIERHIHPRNLQVNLYHGTGRQLSSDGSDESHIVITTYETLRSESEVGGSLFSKKWYRVVLDEAHHIRNRSSQTFHAACTLRSQRRWCLTGTPIHNSLDDFGALMSFIGVSPFLTKSSFDFWISTVVNKEKPEGLSRLRKSIETTCLRRTKGTIQDVCPLPERIETLENVELSPNDRNLYDFFREKTTKAAIGSTKSKQSPKIVTERQNQPKIVELINVLRLICNHGETLLPATAVKSWISRDTRTTDWQLMHGSVMTCQLCSVEIDTTNFQTQGLQSGFTDSSVCRDCTPESGERLQDRSSPSPFRLVDTPADASADQPISAFPTSSAKFQALLRNLPEPSQNSNVASLRPEKSVIFSCWTKMLDLIQQALQARGFIYQRIDGRTSLEARRQAISIFNEDKRCTIMLASIGSTGEGVDFTVANSVHIIEPQWNPMVEAQAVDRVHRIGQDRPVQVTRYLVKDSVETYVRWLQLDKLRMISRSIDSTNANSQQELDDKRWKKLKEIHQCDS